MITNNVVSGNSGEGIAVGVGDQATSTYTISNNFIGTSADGTTAIGNGSTGLALESLENATVDNNVISGNKLLGLDYSGFGQDLENNVFQGNKIGTDVTGLLPLPNLDGGVELSTAIGVTFGGPGAEGNVVAFNDGVGVSVAGQNPTLSEQVDITQNSIFANTGLGIYLGINTVNNNFQMPPVLTWTPIGNGGTGTLTATLATNSIANKSYAIEIFSNPVIPTQGETYVQTLMVTADNTGKGSVSTVLPAGIYTATATELFTSPTEPGNTSQFALPPTVTSLSSSLNPSAVGQPVTFTANVTVPGSSDPATGTVSFTIDGTTQFPSVPLTVVGGVDQALLLTSSLGAGPHTIVATYSGDANHERSSTTLSPQTVTVGSASLTNTATAVVSSLNPSPLGEIVTFTAIVTPSGSSGMPTGSVTFTIDGHALPAAGLSVVGGQDQAQIATTTLTTGPHTVSAAYSGDANFNPSTGNLPTQTVNAAPLVGTATVLSMAPNPSTFGQNVVFTATVTAADDSAVGGTVTFLIGTIPVGTGSVGPDGVATFNDSTLQVGSSVVTATYSGDGLHEPSLSIAVAQVVRPSAIVVPSAVVAPSVVLLQRFGYHMQKTTLVLTFSAALDAASAENLGDYQIVAMGGVGGMRPGRAIAIRQAIYNASALQVTLVPAKRLNIHKTYRLTVNGTAQTGVRGSSGL